MEKITVFEGKVFAIQSRDVDTDQIIPARFLKVDRSLAGGYGPYLFHDLSLSDDDVALLDEARILVAGANFGCGSSREGAVYALVDRGFRAIIAPSFGDIFHNNCLKNGLLPIRLDECIVKDLANAVQLDRQVSIEVDLPEQQIRWCDRQHDARQYGFSIDPFWRECLVTGQDEIALTLSYVHKIEAFESEYFRSPLGACPGTGDVSLP